MHGTSNTVRAAIAALALGGVAVVVAIASRAPVSASTPVDARALQAPTVAVFMLIAGIGIVMLSALVMFAWPGRRRNDDLPEHQSPPPEVHWIWKVLAILVLFALGATLVAAAVIGSKRAQAAPRSGGALVPGGAAPLSRPPSNSTGFVVPSWLPWTVLGIVAVAVIAGLVVLWLRRPRPAAEAPEPMATRAAVDAAIGALDTEADPRRAVIAAYGAMQRTLGEHGMVRSSTEAPREYLQRVLLASHAGEREARTLTLLFEEARYSTHPIPERLRETALASLRSLRRHLQAEGAR